MEPTTAINYEAAYKTLKEEAAYKYDMMREDHRAEVDKLNAEIKRLEKETDNLRVNCDTLNNEWYELFGKVSAYEMCIKAFTGMKEGKPNANYDTR